MLQSFKHYPINKLTNHTQDYKPITFISTISMVPDNHQLYIIEQRHMYRLYTTYDHKMNVLYMSMHMATSINLFLIQ